MAFFWLKTVDGHKHPAFVKQAQVNFVEATALCVEERFHIVANNAVSIYALMHQMTAKIVGNNFIPSQISCAASTTQLLKNPQKLHFSVLLLS